MKKNRKYTSEFKIKCVKEMVEDNIALKEISRRENIDNHTIRRWRDNYLKYGEKYFYEEHRGKGKCSGNPYAALHTKKNLTETERLELENLKLRIKIERLKKGYQVKGVGANKEFISLNSKNTKS